MEFYGYYRVVNYIESSINFALAEFPFAVCWNFSLAMQKYIFSGESVSLCLTDLTRGQSDKDKQYSN